MNATKKGMIGLAVALAAMIGYVVFLHLGPIKQISDAYQKLETASNAEKASLQAELEAGSRREKELEAKIKALEEKVATLSRDKESTQTDLKKEIVQLEGKNEKLDNQLAESRKQLQAISEQSAAKDRKLAQVELERQTLQRLIESQAKEKEELQRLKDNLRNQLGMNRNQIEALSQDAAAKDKQLQSMEIAYQELSKQLEKQIKEKEIQISNLENRLNIRLLDKILFASGSAEITPAGKRVLESLATELTKMEGFEISVAGHTDNLPLGPKIQAIYIDNLGLSGARAAAVARKLNEMGVSPANLSATGYSMYRPVTGNETPAGRQQNRRVEIMLEPLR